MGAEGSNMKVIVTLAAAMASLCLAGAAAAQDWDANPVFGSVALQNGFTPDPHNVSLVAGGEISISDSISSDCRGYVTEAPSYELNYSASDNFPLVISVASDADATLLVNGPDGSWYCDDDAGEGVNPALLFQRPRSGYYHIWVGTYSSTSAPAWLSISEIYTY